MTSPAFKICTYSFLLYCSHRQLQIYLAMLILRGSVEGPKQRDNAEKKNLNKSQNGIFAVQQKEALNLFESPTWSATSLFLLAARQCSIVLGLQPLACVSRCSSQLNLYLSIRGMPVHPPHSTFNAFPVSFLFSNWIIPVLRVTYCETNKVAIRTAYLVPVLLLVLTSDSSTYSHKSVQQIFKWVLLLKISIKARFWHRSGS